MEQFTTVENAAASNGNAFCLRKCNEGLATRGVPSHLHLDREGCLVSGFLDEIEEFIHSLWGQAGVLLSPKDGECLAGASLAVCKDADVVAVQGRLDKVLQSQQKWTVEEGSSHCLNGRPAAKLLLLIKES